MRPGGPAALSVDPAPFAAGDAPDGRARSAERSCPMLKRFADASVVVIDDDAANNVLLECV